MNDPRPRGKQNSAYRSAPHSSKAEGGRQKAEVVLVKPRALPNNPHIAVLPISSPSEIERIAQAKKNLEARGARVTIADNFAHRHRDYLAGTDDERVEELNRYLNSAEFDAFFFTRGGYGAMRIL